MTLPFPPDDLRARASKLTVEALLLLKRENDRLHEENAKLRYEIARLEARE